MADENDKINARAEKLKALTDRLEAGILNVFESEQYKEFLKTMSKFHNYSINNQLLIAFQKPDSTLCAGYKAWEQKFGRHVKKGEKGIAIYTPAAYKRKEEKAVIDPQTNKPKLDALGKPVTEEIEVIMPFFKVGYVYDVSQTEGKELPDIAPEELQGDVEGFRKFFEVLKAVSPVPIKFENIQGEAKGYYSYATKDITIQEGMSQQQIVKTAVHEMAHAKLHDVDIDKYGRPKDKDAIVKDRNTKEVEAESVAFVVCQHFGIDTSEYSFKYLAGWSMDKDLPQLKASLKTIRDTAAEFIDRISAKLREREQNKNIEGEHDFSIEQTENKTFVVKSTSERFGENAVVFESAKRDDCMKYIYDRQPSEEKDWKIYIIPDLKTWSYNEMNKTGIEYFSTFAGAKKRFNELRAEPCKMDRDKEFAHLTMGIAHNGKKGDLDILHVRGGENYLVDDFTRKESVNTDMGAMSIIKSAAEEIGFDRVRVFPEKGNGFKDVSFSDWNNPYFKVDSYAEIPVYRESARYAHKHNERDAWRRSNRINEECARYIQENASVAHNDHRMTEFSNALVDKYGLERAMLVVARNIKSRPGDGRFNRDVVERAAAIEIPDMQLEYDNTRSYICTTHSVILNFVFRDLMDIEKALNRMPDKTTPEQMHDYGYTSDIMMPMDTEAARKYFDKGLTVYALYGDNSESMITSYDEIDAHDGLFGVEADEWKAYLDSEHHAPMAEEKASNKEAAFIFGQEDGFAIYQLRDDVSRDYHFEGLDRIGGAAMVDKSNYQFVYADDIEIGQAENTFDVLENIYEEFNQFKPEDFKGHSLSVSDMVVLKQDGELAVYYVDRFGFENIPHFYGDNPKDLVWDNDKQTYLAKATEHTSIENNITPAEENKNDMQILSEREADELAANPMADDPVGRMEDMVSSGNATSYRAQIERAKQAVKTQECKPPEQRTSLIKRINDNKAKIAGKAAQDKAQTKNKGLEV